MGPCINLTFIKGTYCGLMAPESDVNYFHSIFMVNTGSGKKSRPSSSRSKSPKDKKGRDKSSSPKRSANSKKSEAGSKKGSRGQTFSCLWKKFFSIVEHFFMQLFYYLHFDWLNALRFEVVNQSSCNGT